MMAETYPCYVKIRSSPEEDIVVEIPTQDDGSVFLSTVNSQFPKAIGLRFKSDAGSWRGISLDENKVMIPPLSGWGNTEYFIVHSKALKRKAASKEGPLEKLSKMTEEEILTDLLLLGLPYSASQTEIEKYFSTFGDLELCELKYDAQNKPRGFGFIRFKSVEAVRDVLSKEHVLHGRKIGVRFPKEEGPEDAVPTKIFIGRLTKNITAEDLRSHFSDYGDIKDVYIPQPFKGFGFVTFTCQSPAKEVMSLTHVIKGTYVNVTKPSVKKDKADMNMKNDKRSLGNTYTGKMPHKQMQHQHQQLTGFRGGGYGNNFCEGFGYNYGGGYFNTNNWNPRNPSPGNYGTWEKS